MFSGIDEELEVGQGFSPLKLLQANAYVTTFDDLVQLRSRFPGIYFFLKEPPWITKLDDFVNIAHQMLKEGKK